MAERIIQHTYKLKGGEQEAVERSNPLLLRREPIVVYCKDGITRMKIGDGVHRYSELDWIGGVAVSGGNGSSNQDLNMILSQLSEMATKLKGIEEGATRVLVDKTNLDIDSDNAVSNRLVTQALNNMEQTMDSKVQTKVGEHLETAVLDGGQI